MKKLTCLFLLLLGIPVFLHAQNGDSPTGSDAGDDANKLEVLRARITGGAIFFNSRPRTVVASDGLSATIETSQFGQSSLYLAFDSQPRLWAFSGCPQETDATACDEDKRKEFEARGGYYRFYLDPVLNVRLTTIPVAVGGSQESGQANAVPTESVLSSQKAAQVQLGLVTSFNFHSPFDGDSFHWGIGPIARVMFQSVTDSQRALRVWNISDDLYDATTVGARISIYHKESKESNSWSPAAYLDLSAGKFQNFEIATGKTDAAKACLANPSTPSCLTSPLPKSDFDIRKERRLYVESRLFLKYLYLGFDLNDGRGPDDLRFVFGVTIGIDQLKP